MARQQSFGSLPDGQTIALPTLDRSISVAGKKLDVFDYNDGIRKNWTSVGDAIRTPGDYLAVGQTYVRGALVGGTARREGRTIVLEGRVRFGLDDPFDFRQGQPGGWESVMLERYASARPFKMHAQWDRRLVATVAVERDRAGGLTFVPKGVAWTDVD